MTDILVSGKIRSTRITIAGTWERGSDPSPRLYGYLGYPAQKSYSSPARSLYPSLMTLARGIGEMGCVCFDEKSGSVMGLHKLVALL